MLSREGGTVHNEHNTSETIVIYIDEVNKVGDNYETRHNLKSVSESRDCAEMHYNYKVYLTF